MKSISKLTGFPEWLPEDRMVESALIQIMQQRFELYGFVSLETRSLEPLDILMAKGETDKEMYTVRRLQAESEDSDSKLGLHFDLTVPFARYVVEHKDKLQFPFKRYQIQKVWRGERPQDGRFREFYQADIDIIADEALSLSFDAELPRIILDVTNAMLLPPVTIRINNRKILEGFYRALGVENPTPVFRIVDKLDKIGAEKVLKLLISEVQLDEKRANLCLELAKIQATDLSFVDQVRKLGMKHEILDQGLEELSFVMKSLADLSHQSFVATGAQSEVIADLKIARGLDYYTGTVYECFLQGFEKLGAICSGGRYDNLASFDDQKLKLPGVGVSIGLTRILSKLFSTGYFKTSRKTPTCVLVALTSEESRSKAHAIAATLRSRGISAEVFHEPLKFGKQIRYAEKKMIPFVWFPDGEGDGQQAVKDIRSGVQTDADAATWMPSSEDLRGQIIRSGSPQA